MNFNDWNEIFPQLTLTMYKTHILSQRANVLTLIDSTIYVYEINFGHLCLKP